LSWGFAVQAFNSDCDRRVDFRPETDVNSTNIICGSGITAFDTGEDFLGLSISFVHIITLRTPPGGVPGIDRNHRNTLQKGLVCDKTSQLIERPFSESFPLALSNSYSLPDALEIFKGNRPMGAFCLGNNTFGNNVIRVFLESAFTARKFLEMPLGRLRSFLLKSFFQGVYFLPDMIYHLSGERFSIGIGGKIHDAHVNTKKAFGIDGSSIRNIDHDVQEELPSGSREIRLTTHLVPVKGSIVAEDHGKKETPFDRGQLGVRQILKENKLPVIFNSRVLLEKMLAFPIRLVAVGDLGDGPDNELGLKFRKFFSGIEINKMVQFHLIKCFSLKSLSRNPIAGPVELLHRLKKSFGLFFSRDQFDFQCLFHAIIIGKNITYVKHLTERNIAFLPSLDERTVQERVPCDKA